MSTEIFSNEKINDIKKNNNTKQQERDLKSIDNYLNGLVLEYNKQRIKENSEKIVILGILDSCDLHLYPKVLNKFENKLEKEHYCIDNVKRDKMCDHCPDPVIGFHITVIPVSQKKSPVQNKTCVIN
jgi:hypothetical protein